MSYGTPYVGLNKSLRKVVAYLDTWSVAELKEVAGVNKFLTPALDALKIDRDTIFENSNLQKKLYFESVNDIVSQII